ncbi:MAG: restriction endonuclease subunit S [Candidatus Pacebacteria bacterium]|nr:restriction endonuclease subunit S [Candidatus Paceibacterota bacterium]
MKTNWQTKKLGEVCDISIGKTPARGNEKFWDKEKETNNVWLSIRDLSNTNKKDVFDSREYISDSGAKLCKKVKQGILLASFKLTLGRLAFAGTDLYTNEAIAALEIKNSKELNKEYLYYYLTFFDWHAETKGDIKVKGKTLNKAKLKEIKVFIPLLSEQIRIVKILDEVFGKMEIAKKNAERNLRNAKELFESYLQGVFTNSGDDWEEKRLGDAYDVRDGTHDSPKYQKEGYVLITSKNLKRDELNFKNIKYISEKDYQKINERSKVHKGDILFAMIGTIGNPVVVKVEPVFAIKNVALFKIPKEHDSYFLKYFLDSKFVIDKMISEAKGTTQKFVGLGYLRDFIIKLPKLSEQKQIVIKLDALSASTKKLEKNYQQKIDDLDELKKSVLKKAFEGEL